MPTADILLVEDEANVRKVLSVLLKKKGYVVEAAPNGLRALELLQRQFFDVVITDVRMEPIDGMHVLEQAKKIHPATEVIVITAFGTIESSVKAMKLGAYYYITKPFRNDELLSLVKDAIENRTTGGIKKHYSPKRNEVEPSRAIIASSQVMEQILNLVAQVAITESTILISGESGTGKELIAREIHAQSSRRNKPLITVNCGSLPENLLESELFGHVKGAFTGAIRDKKGLYEEADKGTIFLDEIGEMSLQTQVKILRALQEGEIRRVGDNASLKVDVRIIAATNKNLQEEIEKKNFRQDLYYRLNVIPINLPPLKERKDEIPVLAKHFLNKYANKMGRTGLKISDAALSWLMGRDWPGNVRELENMIERTIILSNHNELQEEDFSLHTLSNQEQIVSPRKNKHNFSLANAEKILILECLENCSGNQKSAADRLGISTTTLWRKLKQYNINLDDVKK